MPGPEYFPKPKADLEAKAAQGDVTKDMQPIREAGDNYLNHSSFPHVSDAAAHMDSFGRARNLREYRTNIANGIAEAQEMARSTTSETAQERATTAARQGNQLKEWVETIESSAKKNPTIAETIPVFDEKVDLDRSNYGRALRHGAWELDDITDRQGGTPVANDAFEKLRYYEHTSMRE